jgi:glycosyltransferase involved in cell wall biosynthesis
MFVSTSDYEGISNSMLEAMAMGLPCVVTDCPCGGARRFIKSYENGILIPTGDTGLCYKAMRYLIDNPDKANIISEKAEKIREELTVNQICLNWMEVLGIR